MKILEQLNRINNLPIYPVTDAAFAAYGRILQGYDFDELVCYAQQNTPIPEEGNLYVASSGELEQLAIHGQLRDGVFGGMPIQMGYCNGKNSWLNCFEYHKSSEVNVAVTPQVLLMAHINDLTDNSVDASCAKAFYLPQGLAIEIFATTLHFAPCKVSDNGFQNVVVLPDNTNTPLTFDLPQKNAEDKLLWMTNKWLITLPDTIQAQKGAFVGIKGDNIQIYY